MDLNKGANVHTIDGQSAGHIERVVIDPKTKAVIAVVIHEGVLFTKDKVVPIASIHAEPGQPLVIQLTADKLDALPDYEETHYIVVDEDHLGEPQPDWRGLSTPAVYLYSPIMATPVTPPQTAPLIEELQVNIPDGTVAVKEGALVLSSDEKHVGTVEKVLTNSQTSQVTHLLVSRGILQKERRLIPVAWIDSLDDKEVRLTVSAAVVGKVPLFEQAEASGSSPAHT